MSDIGRRYGSGSELDSLVLELEHVLREYEEQLCQANAREMLAVVGEWLERFVTGSFETGKRLENAGLKMLFSVMTRLRDAAKRNLDGGAEEDRLYAEACQKILAVMENLVIVLEESKVNPPEEETAPPPVKAGSPENQKIAD